MRSLKDLLAVLDALELPYTQIQWTPASAPDLPYIVVVPDETDNRSGDNVVYRSTVHYLVELYTRTRDVPLEKKVQDALTEAGIFYQRYTTVVPNGYAVLTRYSMMLTE